jgi:hypothetical protein
MKLLEIVKDNNVTFDFMRAGTAYYNVIVDNLSYRFPVPLEDIGDATLMKEDKAIIFMRWIRASIINNTLVRC